jgi:DNA mismatch repair protein MSH5
LEVISRPYDGENTNIDVQILKKNEYSDETAKQRLLTMNLEGVPRFFFCTFSSNFSGLTFLQKNSSLHAPADRELWVASMIDFNKKEMLRAVGALIGHLGQDGGANKIQLSEVSAAGLVRMDADAFQSLQIFGTEYHPSAAGVGVAKEGFSLFARMNRARSVGGRRLLRQWFARPTNSIKVLNDRLDHVERLRDPRHSGVVKQAQTVLASVKDARRICSNISKLTATCSDWISLRQTLAAALEVRDLTRPMNAESGLRILSELQRHSGIQSLGKLLQLMDAVIDFDQSRQTKRLTVRAGVDCTLDDLKRTYDGLGDLLTRVASEQINALPETVQIESLSTVYFPMIGYAVVVPRKPGMSVGAQIQNAALGNLQYQFDTEAYIYYKSDITRDLDTQLGDVHSLIVDRENQCIRELETHILDRSETMTQVHDILAELDCLLSLAISSTELRMERPLLTEDPGVLMVRDGRHPLQELTVSTFVPNDTDLTQACHAQLITGPNASGKSVYIKQTALIAYLAHIGSFVPATSAVVSMLDGIYARIQTRESAAVGKSSFLLDLTQVSTMIRHATPKSLCLLDEFGKGTDPADGAGLLGACLEQLIRKNSFVLATTHFSELLGSDILRVNQRLARKCMSFVLRVPDQQHHQGVVLIYKLRDELDAISSSYGTYCARTAGVPDAIIARAEQVQKHIAQGSAIGRLESVEQQHKEAQHRKIFDLLMAWDEQDPQDLLKQIFS